MMTERDTAPVVALKERADIIQAQPAFSGLSPEELVAMAELLSEVHAGAGEEIVHEADPVDSVYFIIKGNADVRHITYADGVQNIESVATLPAGGTIGLNETGFFSLTGRRTATVVANTDMLLLRLGLAVFHGFALVNRNVSRLMRERAAAMLRMR